MTPLPQERIAALLERDRVLRHKYRPISREALVRQILAHAPAAPPLLPPPPSHSRGRQRAAETPPPAAPGRVFRPEEIARLGGAAVAGGQEHRVHVPFLADALARLIKVTHSDRTCGGFGLVPCVRSAREITLRPGTFAEYLARLAPTNALFGDDWRCEGLLRHADGSCSAVTSQPAIGVPTGQRARPTAAEICRYFEARGFLPVAGEEARTFYRVHDNVAVFDAHEGNLLLTPEGLLPIDVIAVHPDDRLLAVLERGL